MANLNGTTERKENYPSNSPPGTVLQRFVKKFWYNTIYGTYISFPDTLKSIFFVKPPVIDIEKLEKRADQVAVMTGEPRGIGFNIVKKLLQLDYTVILGVPNMTASVKGIEEIRKLGVTFGRVKFFNLDLKSLKSVRNFAKNVLVSEEGYRIDLLLNHAGICLESYEKTEDNYESIFQVNYLGHFLLTNLLLPRIKETAARKNVTCQIVNTSSHVQCGGKIDFDELETSPVKCYYDSKLCLVIHVRTLEKMFREENLNIHAYACHPGEIPMTGIWDGFGFLSQFFNFTLLKCVGRTPDEAANTILYPVLNRDVGEKCGGEHFENGNVKTANPQAYLPEIQKRLWDRSLELTQDVIMLKQE